MGTTELYNLANLFVLPFWTLMIILPNWGVTRKIMESYLPFVVLIGVYIYFIAGAITPESAQALSNPQLADIARFFSEPKAAATGWVHFLVMDLFVGRWIYWEGQKTGVLTIHSLILCLFAGPVGLLSHIVTAYLSNLFGSKADKTTANPLA